MCQYLSLPTAASEGRPRPEFRRHAESTEAELPTHPPMYCDHAVERQKTTSPKPCSLVHEHGESFDCYEGKALWRSRYGVPIGCADCGRPMTAVHFGSGLSKATGESLTPGHRRLSPVWRSQYILFLAMKFAKRTPLDVGKNDYLMTDGRANRSWEHRGHRRSFFDPPRHVAFVATDDTFHPPETSGLCTAPRECSRKPLHVLPNG